MVTSISGFSKDSKISPLTRDSTAPDGKPLEAIVEMLEASTSSFEADQEIYASLFGLFDDTLQRAPRTEIDGHSQIAICV